MSDHHGSSKHAPNHPPGHEEPFDQEIDVRGIVKSGVALAITIIVSMVLMWWLSVALKQRAGAPSSPPSPLAEVAEPRQPPYPRLQAQPEAELKALHAEEAKVLESYGWIDKGRGVARIPIDKAIEIVGQRGLPAPATLLEAAQPATVGGGTPE
jgi:hypothetical protein